MVLRLIGITQDSGFNSYCRPQPMQNNFISRLSYLENLDLDIRDSSTLIEKWTGNDIAPNCSPQILGHVSVYGFAESAHLYCVSGIAEPNNILSRFSNYQSDLRTLLIFSLKVSLTGISVVPIQTKSLLIVVILDIATRKDL